MLKIGSKVRFTYLKEAQKGIVNGILTADYAAKAENYKGKVVDVRSLKDHPVSNQTLRYGNIKGDRSENLITVELKNGDTKAFYDGRMVNLKVRKYAQPTAAKGVRSRGRYPLAAFYYYCSTTPLGGGGKKNAGAFFPLRLDLNKENTLEFLKVFV